MSPFDRRICSQLDREVAPEVRAFARLLGEESAALAVLFYGSNLRTGSLDGVLDFYVLLPGPQRERIWPRVSYREWDHQGRRLRAKIATMALEKFDEAARGDTIDTTIWARFVQPSALVHCANPDARGRVVDAIGSAAQTAARLAAALGPIEGYELEYWRGLFRATYAAEFRVESGARADTIVETHRAHFSGLLPLALAAQGIEVEACGNRRDAGDADATPRLRVRLDSALRRQILRWWRWSRRAGKPLNIVRLIKASWTFEGAARYAAWKIERHSGVKVKLTPWRERHPLLAAPLVLVQLWRAKRDEAANRPAS